MTYPLKHISIRVPWHDTGWDGRVCAAPRLNAACLKLKRIAEHRDDDAEESVAGKSIKDLPQAKWPACVAERVGFMAPFEYIREANHPYNHGPDTIHGHFKSTALRHPPYSAPTVAFGWMLRESMGTLGEEQALDVQAEREPDLGFKTQWVQERQNQMALLDCFAGHLQPERSKLKGYTIAQFLRPDRYDGATRRYRLSDKPTEPGAHTVIIDEASMLTEEMTAALIQALKGTHRLILIGDPRQLPPIGAGRPFVDIVKHLTPEGITEKLPRVGPGYAELTIRRRQSGVEREDLQLAGWFSGSAIAPGEDDVFDKVVRTGKSKHVQFVQWETTDDLRSNLIEVLVGELKLKGPDDIAGFDATLGGAPWNDLRFFNVRRGENAGAAETAEGWQILSPVRSTAHGVPDLNRLIHKQFRQEMIDASRKQGWQRKYPKPMGAEEIVYGDKVINLVNTDPSDWWNRHRKVYPAKDDAYIANGEIGMAVGYFWKKGSPDLRWKLEVEFSSQPSYKYNFTKRDFSEEGNPVLELAYALTVHKSQGSEFGTVIVVLPNPCRLLSRELLYTALTRQKNRIVILHQGPRIELRKYSSDDRSETARRLTNLFVAPSPVLINGRFYEKYLIHRTAREEMVRSKSEVIIADHLANKGIDYRYEQPLTIEGVTKYPDFTVEDMESGLTYYWEHCGMLHVPTYRRRWEEKLAWYRTHDILPYEEGGGDRGILIITRDEANGSIDSSKITKLMAEVLVV